MRTCCEEGAGGPDRGRLCGHRGLARGEPARRAGDRGRAAAVDRSRGRGPPVRPGGLRGVRPGPGHGRRQPPRPAGDCPDDDARRRSGCCGSSTPRATAPATSDVPDPYYGGERGFEQVLDLVEAATRGLVAELRAGGLRVSRPDFEAVIGAPVAAARRVGGGCINEGWRVELESGEALFVKTRAEVAPGEYAAEAEGLRWLAEPGAVRVPAVRAVGDDLLALEWIDEGRSATRARRSSAAGWPSCTQPAPTGSAGTLRSARPTRDLQRPGRITWPDSTPSGGCARSPGRLATGIADARRRGGGRCGLRADRRPPGRSRRAACAPARRPVGRQRAGRRGRPRGADRPCRARRASRGRPYSPVRLARRAVLRRLRGGRPAGRWARGSGHTGSCSAAGPRGFVRRVLRCSGAHGPFTGGLNYSVRRGIAVILSMSLAILSEPDRTGADPR